MRVTFIWVILLLFLPAEASYQWAPGSQVTEPERVCQKARRLRGRLGRLCQEEKDLFEKIKSGIALGIQHCQNQFRDRRWNCATEKKSLKKVLKQDTPETAFVNAVTAAAVTYEVATACNTGKLIDCYCDRGDGRKPNPHVEVGIWKWGGCRNSVTFGLNKSKAFLDYPYKKNSDMKTLVRLHNNQAGRLAIQNYVTIKCKCHGISGSCSVKICWRKMPNMEDVARRLRDQYDRAVRVIPSNDGHHFIPDRYNTRRKPLKALGREKLVFAQNSTDFCKYNRKFGSLGTQGRVCNVTSTGIDGCIDLCCYRGFRSDIVHEVTNCRCSFTFCCKVECDTCRTPKIVHVCN